MLDLFNSYFWLNISSDEKYGSKSVKYFRLVKHVISTNHAEQIEENLSYPREKERKSFHKNSISEDK